MHFEVHWSHREFECGMTTSFSFYQWKTVVVPSVVMETANVVMVKVHIIEAMLKDHDAIDVAEL